MKYKYLFLALVLVATPSFASAQRGGGHSGGSHGGVSHGGSHSGGFHGGHSNGGSHSGVQRGVSRPSAPRGGSHSGVQHRAPQDRDRNGHRFNRGNFGREHYMHFGINYGRWHRGRREYFFGGLWFYPYGGIWPEYFYHCPMYFDYNTYSGLWYAYCYDSPNELYFQVYVN